MPTKTDITVVVPTWRRASYLDRCLAAIWSQGLLPERVIVVGRDADDDARAVVDGHSREGRPIHWCRGAQPGHVEPVCRGLAEVATQYVAFLDDDTEAM